MIYIYIYEYMYISIPHGMKHGASCGFVNKKASLEPRFLQNLHTLNPAQRPIPWRNVAPWCRAPVAQVPLHHRWSHWWFPTASHFFGKGGSMWLNHQQSLVFHEFSHPESFLDSGKGWSIMIKKAFRFLITGSTWLADFKCWRLAKKNM